MNVPHLLDRHHPIRFEQVMHSRLVSKESTMFQPVTPSQTILNTKFWKIIRIYQAPNNHKRPFSQPMDTSPFRHEKLNLHQECTLETHLMIPSSIQIQGEE